MTDETWWFHLYVMLSRATRMEDLLLLRPPPKDLLERGPPAAILRALQRFIHLERDSVAEATRLCSDLGIVLPDEAPPTVAPARRRMLRKGVPPVNASRDPPFVRSSEFAGLRTGYHFKNGSDGLGYYLDPQGR